MCPYLLLEHRPSLGEARGPGSGGCAGMTSESEMGGR